VFRTNDVRTNLRQRVLGKMVLGHMVQRTNGLRQIIFRTNGVRTTGFKTNCNKKSGVRTIRA
jgi:hypothetical protein